VEHKGIGAINWAFRGDRTTISAFGGDRLVDTKCNGDGLCADVCPVGAISRIGKKSE
jgi:ferredoxin